jgi:hypothetical protein
MEIFVAVDSSGWPLAFETQAEAEQFVALERSSKRKAAWFHTTLELKSESN